MLRLVFAFIILLLSISYGFTFQLFRSCPRSTSTKRIPHVTQQIHRHITRLHAVQEREKKDKRGIVMFREEMSSNLWNESIANSFNSSTLRVLFGLQQEVTSFFVRIEQAFTSFAVKITSKVERDIKVTSKASDYISRKIDRDVTAVSQSITEFTRPVFQLPSAISMMTNSSTSFGIMLGSGLNPFERPQLLGTLSSSTTSQRAKRIKFSKPVKKSLGVDSVYRSIRDLPSTLQYDYNRRVIARESSKFGDARIESILPNQVSTDLNGDLNAKEGNQVTSSNEGSSQQQQQQQFNVDVLRLLSCEMKWLQAYLNEYLQQLASSSSSETEAVKTQLDLLRVATKNLEVSANAATLLVESGSFTLDDDDTKRRCLTAMKCLPSLNLLVETSQFNDDPDRVASVLQILTNFDGKFRSNVDISAIAPVVWTPAAITLPSLLSPIGSDLSLMGSPPFMLPSSSGAVKKEVASAKKQQPKLTFVEYLETQSTAAPDERIQRVNADVYSLDGDIPFVESEQSSYMDEGVLNGVAYSSTAQSSSFTVDASKSKSERRASSDTESVVVESVVIETTAVEDVTSDAKALKLALAGIDIVFFLLEALAKAVVPLVRDGGAQAVARIVQALDVRKIRTPLNQWVAARSRVEPAGLMESDWELLDSLKTTVARQSTS